MTPERNALKAGLFMIAMLAAALGVLVGIRGLSSLLEPSKYYTVRFNMDDNIGGLKSGDSVRVGGWERGKVSAIRLESKKDAPTTIAIDFFLPQSIDLRADAAIQVQEGLTGNSNLNIYSLGTGKALAAGDAIKGYPSWMSQFATIPAKANELIDSAKPAIAHADETLVHVRNVITESKNDLKDALTNVRDATATIKTRLPGSMDRIDKFLESANTTIDSTKDTIADIRAAAANTKDVTGEAKSILTRNRSKIDLMLQSLRTTSANLEGASSEIRRSPWRLLYKPSADEMSNLNLFDTARAFATAAEDLNDAASAVRDASKDATIQPDQLQGLMKKLDESFDKYKGVEKKLWDEVK